MWRTHPIPSTFLSFFFDTAMTFSRARTFALACALAGIALPAAAQDPDDPFETARFRLGAIRFTPVVELTNLGTDSNVFNEPDNPRSDTTAAIGPTVKFWMRPGIARLSGRTGGQYLYFREYDSQRAWNTAHDLKVEFLLTRLTPFASVEYIDSKDRVGYEIDSRSRRRDLAGTVGTGVRIGGKTQLVASYRRFHGEYDEEETFLGATLARELNRDEEQAELQFRYALTPLTTFVVRNELGRDRFESTGLRDSDSLRVMPGFELQPAALISGTIFVGYRHFDAKDARVEDYSGIAAAVSAVYVRNATKFEVRVDRDLAYSYSIERPYYALLDSGLVVTHRFPQRWEAVGRVSRQALAYRLADPEAADAPTDRGYTYGAGIGVLPAETLRLGFDVLYSTRRSEVAGRRDFDGTRLFGSISYGIRQ
jgi:hypothetical protein